MDCLDVIGGRHRAFDSDLDRDGVAVFDHRRKLEFHLALLQWRFAGDFPDGRLQRIWRGAAVIDRKRQHKPDAAGELRRADQKAASRRASIVMFGRHAQAVA